MVKVDVAVRNPVLLEDQHSTYTEPGARRSIDASQTSTILVWNDRMMAILVSDLVYNCELSPPMGSAALLSMVSDL